MRSLLNKIFLFIIVLSTHTACAISHRPPTRPPGHGVHVPKPPVLRPGMVVKTLPRPYTKVYVNRQARYYSHGNYFRKVSRGYQVVRIPHGAHIVTKPGRPGSIFKPPHKPQSPPPYRPENDRPSHNRPDNRPDHKPGHGGRP